MNTRRELTPLLTDLYELTMAAGYWKTGMAERESVFHLFFRSAPFNGGYTIAAGLASAIEWLKYFQFSTSDLDYLGTLKGNRGTPHFPPEFLKYLSELRWTCDVDAVPDGTVVFPDEPLVRVRGPILQAQLVETALLTMINYQTLIATKAARICQAAQGDPVIEFGLRRAQGPDGGLSASRAAFIGGCSGTSNVLAGKIFGIPVKGTHAHSWVMSFDDEMDSFTAYADAMPDNCLLLVDTYDSLQGVRHAVEIGRRLRERGHELSGIRLDSGDLAWLSIEARRILDEDGFPDAAIVASNDLDEHLVESLKHQGARINVWGIGTRLVTGGDQAALGGVYKLAAIRDEGGTWKPRIKLSEQTAKTSIPGIQQVRRFIWNEEFCGDAIFDETTGFPVDVEIVDPFDPIRRKRIPRGASHEDLLVPIFRQGSLVYEVPELTTAQARVHEQLSRLHTGVRRLHNPHRYPAGLERTLAKQRDALIRKATQRKYETENGKEHE